MVSGVLLASRGEKCLSGKNERNQLAPMGAGNQEQQMAEISYPPFIFV